jgi:hypothetical protein
MKGGGNPVTTHKITRIFSLFLCVVFLCLSIFSAVYVIEHINHAHGLGETEHTCATCRQIRVAQALLETTGFGLMAVAACAAVAAVLIKPIVMKIWKILGVSPVTLKSKLNN